MKREVVEIVSGNSVYVLDKGFVEMVRSKRGFFYKKMEITDDMLIAFCIEQDAVVERLDLIGGLI